MSESRARENRTHGLKRWGWKRSGSHRASPRPYSVLDLADDRPGRDGRADLRAEALDGAGAVGVQRLLHLHGLQDDDEVAFLDLLPLLHRDLDDGALHRGGEGVARGHGTGLLRRTALGPGPGRETRAGQRHAERGGQGDLETLAADLDDDRLPVDLLLGLGVRAGREGLDLVDELGLDPPGVDRERIGGAGELGG